MDFPPLTGLPPAGDVKAPTAAPPSAPSKPASNAGLIEISFWDELAEKIDEFEVAKVIVDHFDAQPRDLNHDELDLFALYMRAKVTLKRQQVAWAETQKALAQAQANERARYAGLAGLWRRVRSLADVHVEIPFKNEIFVLAVFGAFVLSR